MRPCLKYWGGKQTLARKIIALMPKHFTYCEPFFGGGSVFFTKAPSRNEVINDLNENVVNFYQVLKHDFKRLYRAIDGTLYSEAQCREAREIYRHGLAEDKVRRAWAVFVLSYQCFSGILGETWAYYRLRNRANNFDRAKKRFHYRYVRRLEGVQIFQNDALQVIENMDAADTFHFIDPPYFNADMGHYGGYTEGDFEALLDLLGGLQGKFLMTTYPSALLTRYAEQHGWLRQSYEFHLNASNSDRRKVEVFTMNYSPRAGQMRLFS